MEFLILDFESHSSLVISDYTYGSKFAANFQENIFMEIPWKIGKLSI